MIPTAPPGFLLCVDTSAAQGRLDVAALQAAGIAMVIAKATQGLHDVDRKWAATVAAERNPRQRPLFLDSPTTDKPN